MIKALKKPVNVKQAKRTVGGYKSQYQQYKRRGGTKGFNSWAIDKGYAKWDKTCCIQKWSDPEPEEDDDATLNAPCWRKSRVSVESGGHLWGQTEQVQTV